MYSGLRGCPICGQTAVEALGRSTNANNEVLTAVGG